MCPSEDRCLECDWRLQQWRPPAPLCHLCGCSPYTGFDYLLLLECEIWICLFITQSLPCVGAWATADDCLVVAAPPPFFCPLFWFVAGLCSCAPQHSSNSRALCKQGKKVNALMFCFRNGNYGPPFGFVCLVSLKWFQQLLVALSCTYLLCFQFTDFFHFLYFNWETVPAALTWSICAGQNTSGSFYAY